MRTRTVLLLSTSLAMACTTDEPMRDGGALLLRFSHLSVESGDVQLCGDGEPIDPVGARAIAYPQTTRYLEVPATVTIDIVRAGQDCGAPPLATTHVVAPIDELATLVLIGDPMDETHPLSLQLLLDESNVPPISPATAKARNFNTDTEAGAIDIGFSPGPDVRLFVFENVEYGRTAAASTIGTLSARGYVDGIPAPLAVDRLDIWEHGTSDVLGWFDTGSVPFEPGTVYSIFPAGRVHGGTPEAVVCVDDPGLATTETPLADCGVFVPHPGP